jgi:hypothetical protein
MIVVASGALLSAPARADNSGNYYPSSVEKDIADFAQCDASLQKAGVNGNYHYAHWSGDVEISIDGEVDSAEIVVFGSSDLNPFRHPSLSQHFIMHHFVANHEQQWVRTTFANNVRLPIIWHGKRHSPVDFTQVRNFGCGIMRVTMRNGDTETDASLLALYHRTDDDSVTTVRPLHGPQ